MIKVSKAEQKEKVFYKWTGLTNVRVVAINPTIQEGEALGIKVFNDQYFGQDKNNNRQLRIDFHVVSTGPEAIPNKVTFYIGDFLVPESGTTPGNFQWIDNFGSASYAKDTNSFLVTANMDKTTARRSKSGESTLNEFIKAWVLNKGDECILDISDLVTNGVKPLKDLIPQADASDREVKCLYLVNEKGYTNVYGRRFDSQYQAYIPGWKKELGKAFTIASIPPSQYQETLQFKGFDDNNPSNLKVSASIPVPTNNDELVVPVNNDDLPF